LFVSDIAMVSTMTRFTKVCGYYTLKVYRELESCWVLYYMLRFLLWLHSFSVSGSLVGMI
jgi:hypothetical protein